MSLQVQVAKKTKKKLHHRRLAFCLSTFGFLRSNRCHNWIKFYCGEWKLKQMFFFCVIYDRFSIILQKSKKNIKILITVVRREKNDKFVITPSAGVSLALPVVFLSSSQLDDKYNSKQLLLKQDAKHSSDLSVHT